jgi:hypothetical protein
MLRELLRRIDMMVCCSKTNLDGLPRAAAFAMGAGAR